MNEMTKPAAPHQGRRPLDDQGRQRKAVPVRKMRRRSESTAGTILFVHGSSMAAQPTFDLHVEGRPDSSAMDWFARRGFDCWSVDMEGYGRSTKDRDNNAPIAQGADDCFAAASYIQKLRGKRPFLVYGISSGALRAALFAERHPELVGSACARCHGVDRRRLADACRAQEKASRVPRQEPPADRQGVHPFDLRPRSSRHRGGKSHRRVRRCGDRARHFGANRNLCRYVRAICRWSIRRRSRCPP